MRSTNTVIAIVLVAVVLGGLIYVYRDAPFPWSPDSYQSALDRPGRAIKQSGQDTEQSSKVDPGLEKEAKEYIREITEAENKPLPAGDADDFVTENQPISMFPKENVEVVAPSEIVADPSLALDTPITVIRETEQIEISTPQGLAADAGSDPNQPIKILENGEIRETTVGQVLEDYAETPDAPISLVKKVENLEVTTVGELQKDESLMAKPKIKIIRKPYRLETTSVGELLMGELVLGGDTVFYVRSVTEVDNQGIWGIVHHAVIDNFAKGIAIRRGEDVGTYQVEIPKDADERLLDESSSFLGREIDEKTRDSYVYNFNEGRMGRNPDFIYPGQEIVIVGFEPKELVAIYEHFVTRAGTH
ncbi:MAG: hypothetical protein L0Y67_02400 [Gammaproteobacteria bacterium]|nr:hypothetical protein [Gammaproteobacteria bacterium]MCI0590452.1 hypothetical protein [Gammaproteobacteria bacterium]